ncbi:MAG: DUF5658 family protein [Methanomicrobiales archaeon]|nr:DUF5658 family protein [Methanomicrobiales archaeon]
MLITLYACLTWLDVVLTTVGIERGGTELNPFLFPVVHIPGLFISVKMIGFVLIVILALFCRYFTRKGDYVVMSTACSLGIIPVIWNLGALGWW